MVKYSKKMCTNFSVNKVVIRGKTQSQSTQWAMKLGKSKVKILYAFRPCRDCWIHVVMRDITKVCVTTLLDTGWIVGYVSCRVWWKTFLHLTVWSMPPRTTVPMQCHDEPLVTMLCRWLHDLRSVDHAACSSFLIPNSLHVGLVRHTARSLVLHLLQLTGSRHHRNFASARSFNTCTVRDSPCCIR
jgi:hypothetical protein